MNASVAELPVVHLKIERRSNHPWIFQKMVEKPVAKPRPGSIVDIVDNTGHWVGRGFYNGHSRIALRVLTEDHDEAIDEAPSLLELLPNLHQSLPPEPYGSGRSVRRAIPVATQPLHPFP